KSKLDEANKQKFREVLADLETINKMRNEYIHALYEINLKTLEVTRTTWITATNRTRKVSIITAESVSADRVKVMKTHGAIMRKIFGDELQPPALPAKPQ